MKKTKIIEYGLIFFLFLFWNLIISPINLDEIWNYGFTRNIYLGLIPYKDFNMIVTPLFPMLFSIPMHIVGDNMLFFHIENAILLTGIIYYIEKIIGNNKYYILPFFLWPLNITYPSYNLFSFFLVLLILFLEDKKDNDSKIGILLGLLFLAKQSIGLLFILIQFIMKKKKRVLLSLIPILIFGLYLLITNSFSQFIDQCFLGLLDFNGNGNYFNILFFITIIFLILNITMIIKDRRNTSFYYLLAYSIIVFPLFDYYHFLFYFILFIILFLKTNKYQFIKYNLIGKIVFLVVIGLSILSFKKGSYPNNFTPFQYRYIPKEYQLSTIDVNNLIKKYKKVMIVGPNAYYHKIILNQKIKDIDLINKGNWGYKGSEKLKKKVNEIKEEYVFFIDKGEIGIEKQTDQEIIKYIKENATRIENTKYYEIYQFE